VGISIDSWFAHEVYAEMLDLPEHFDLLSDFPEHPAGSICGSWNPSIHMDDRLTVVVNPHGRIVYKTFNDQDRKRDPREALDAIGYSPR
jgi:peroxiredoxin